jgi:hypothetical protein
MYLYFFYFLMVGSIYSADNWTKIDQTLNSLKEWDDFSKKELYVSAIKNFNESLDQTLNRELKSLKSTTFYLTRLRYAGKLADFCALIPAQYKQEKWQITHAIEKEINNAIEENEKISQTKTPFKTAFYATSFLYSPLLLNKFISIPWYVNAMYCFGITNYILWKVENTELNSHNFAIQSTRMSKSIAFSKLLL